jgi:hypothetical protein
MGKKGGHQELSHLCFCGSDGLLETRFDCGSHSLRFEASGVYEIASRIVAEIEKAKNRKATRRTPNSQPTVSWTWCELESCPPKSPVKKGGVGSFLREIPRILLMGLELRGGYLVGFARFCDTFRDVLASAERSGRPWLLRRFFGYFLALCLPSGGLLLLCAFGG